jgi:hypothetical protein
MIKADLTIDDAVRNAAIGQAHEVLLFWEPMLAGHNAAHGGDWAAAVDAFDRATKLAHWHWLAMASLAAGRHDTYQRSCDEMARRFDGRASGHDIYWIVRTWFAKPHDSQELNRLEPFLPAFVRQYCESRPNSRLYALRTDKSPGELPDFNNPLATVSLLADDWYVLAVAWHESGDATRAESAYQQGMRQARSSSQHWDWCGKVFRDTLRLEVEGLLAANPSFDGERPTDATTDSASPSDSRSSGEAAVSDRSGASK